MSIFALQVLSRTAHPQADALDVYAFGAPGRDDVQVVGNRERVH